MNFATQAGGRRVISPLIPSARNTYTSSVLKTQKMSITASFSTELIILKLLSHPDRDDEIDEDTVILRPNGPDDRLAQGRHL